MPISDEAEWVVGLRIRGEGEPLAVAARHGDEDVGTVQECRVAAPANAGTGDQINLEAGISEVQMPAVAEIETLACIEGVIGAHNGDGDAGDRNGEVGEG